MNNTQQYTYINITGPDAATFLQGQITCDIEKVNSPTLGAICNNKGRVICIFHISRLDPPVKPEDDSSGYQLHLPTSVAEKTIEHLKKFAVFSKVEISIDENNQAEAPNVLEKIKNGIAEIYDVTSEQFTPHDLNLQLVGAIDFEKGCYQGQEIIARMHYRGTLKTHGYRASVKTDTTPQPGDELVSDDKLVGTIIEVAHDNDNQYQLFASIKDQAVEDGEIFLSKDNHAKMTVI